MFFERAVSWLRQRSTDDLGSFDAESAPVPDHHPWASLSSQPYQSAGRSRVPRGRPGRRAPVTTQRNREVAQILVAVRDWAVHRPDVRAVALAGSWAHGDATMASDVDIVALCADPEAYFGDLEWTEPLGNLRFLEARQWGPLTELRFDLPSGLEIDFGVAPLSWAATSPPDEGTCEVVDAGIAILHDPDRLLKQLERACRLRSW